MMQSGMKITIGVLLLVLLVFPARLFAENPPQELIVWGPARDRGLEAVLRQFEVEHPGWKVVIGNIASMGGQKLMTAIAGGDPPDVVLVDRFAVGEWVARDTFHPLNDWIDRSLADEKLAHQVFDSVRGINTSEGPAALDKLIVSLEPRGPTRQLELARSLKNDGLSLDKAAELLTVIQGMHGEDYYAACWNETVFTRDGKKQVFGLPNGTDDRALFYNEDLLERAGLVDENGKARPPRDWDELKEYAVKLTERDKDGRITRLGFAPNFGNSWLYIYGFLNEGKFMSDDGRTCLLNEPRIVDALKFMVDIYDSLGGVEKVDSFQTTFQTNELDPFVVGKVAMKIDMNWTIMLVADHSPNMRFNVIPAPAPKGKPSVTWSGGFAWCIPVGAKQPEMAFELLRFLSSDRAWLLNNQVNAQYMASRGRVFLPGMTPVPHVNQKLFDLYVRDNPDLTPRLKTAWLTCTDLMNVSRFRPVTPVGQLLWDQHVEAFEKATRHVYSPQEALDRGAKVVQRELDAIFVKNPPPPLNWTVPMTSLALLLTLGVAFIYFYNGRRALLRQMGKPESLAGYFFASPWLIGFVVFTAGPIFASIVYSFCQYDVLHPAKYVGLDNYREMLTGDRLFRLSLANTLYMMIGIPIGMAAGLAIAMLLNTDVRGLRAYRTIFYLPAVVPAVASSILWIWVLNPQLGLINSFLRMLGVDDPPTWLNSTSWAFGSKAGIILMGLWGAGAGMVFWLAGLKSIPEHLYEAADIDGAGPLTKFRHVTLPMLSPYIFFALITGVIGTLQIFSEAYIMTQGGPDGSTTFYAYYLFNNAFRYFKMGYASAMAWILFLIVLVLTLVQMAVARRWVHYETD